MAPSTSNNVRVVNPIVEFFSIDLPEDSKAKFSCVFPSTVRGARCKNGISSVDRKEAKELRKVLMSLSSVGSHHKVTLKKLAELCHCKSTHRKGGYEFQLSATVELWYRNLQEHISPNSQVTPTETLPSTSTSSPNEQTTNISEVAPRQILTRSATQNLNDDQLHATITRPPHAYNPYPSAPRTLSEVNTSLLALIRKRLNSREIPSGYVYIYKRDNDLPNHFKIGFTTQSPSERAKGWESKCKYTPYIVFESPWIAHANRVENLVMAELAMARRQENYCKSNPLCMARHREWFNIDLETAKEVVMRWVGWMTMEPYGGDRELVEEWRDHVYTSRVRPASRDGVEQGDRWDRWIEDFYPPVSISYEEEDGEVDSAGEATEAYDVHENANTEETEEDDTEDGGLPVFANTPCIHSRQSHHNHRCLSNHLPATAVSQSQINDAFEVLRRAGLLRHDRTRGSAGAPFSSSTSDTASAGSSSCGWMTAPTGLSRQTTLVFA
jgi:hypothetical protein